MCQLDILELQVEDYNNSTIPKESVGVDVCGIKKSHSVRQPDINHHITHIRGRSNLHGKKKSKQILHENHCGTISMIEHQRRDSRSSNLGNNHVSADENPIAGDIEDGRVYAMLRGGLELVRRLLVIKEEIQKLVLLFRDAEFGGAPPTFERLVPLIARISATIYQADGGAILDRWHAANIVSPPPSGSTGPVVSGIGVGSAIRALALTAGGAGAASRSAILMQGWVVSTEWRGIWRQQLTEYACLCDDHTLYLFTNRQQSVDYIFELARARAGDATEASARILKASAPRRKVNLSEGRLAVRRAELPRVASHSLSDKQRQAFALFDIESGEMQLIMDVTTPREAELWAHAIQTELDFNVLYTRMREMHSYGVMNNNDAMPSQSFIVPLRWLHAQLDRLDGKARSERIRSRSFEQAIKDLQRDRINIDGITLPGANVERVLVALTTRLLSLMGGSHPTRGTKSNLLRNSECSVSTYGDAFGSELNALCFARQLVISCSRTLGGGDILDTLHLMFNKDRYCICPDHQQSTPIEVYLRGSGNGGQIHADITLSMVYKIIPIESIGDSDESNNKRNAMAEAPLKEQRVIATYTQRLTGAALEWREVGGSVRVDLTLESRSSCGENASEFDVTKTK